METKIDPSVLVEGWLDDNDVFDIIPEKDFSGREYKDKLIAWFDVLGMSKKITDSGKDDTGAEEILTNLGKLRNCVDNSCELLMRQEKLEYIQLNDGFVIVSDLDCIDDLCRILCEIQWKVLVELNMTIRGALTAGQIITNTDPKVIIGPAFIKAHTMEEKNAIFPRILFCDEIFKYIKKETIKFQFIVDDTDQLKYLDYFNYIIKLEKELKIFDHKLNIYGIKQYIYNYYHENINHNVKLAQKYGWMISKLKACKINMNNLLEVTND